MLLDVAKWVKQGLSADYSVRKNQHTVIKSQKFSFKLSDLLVQDAAMFDEEYLMLYLKSGKSQEKVAVNFEYIN